MINRLLADIRAAVMLLTRLPVWKGTDDGPPDLSRSVWAYPLVGALVGGIGAAAFTVFRNLVSPQLSAVVACTAMILATGAFHEDGLADTADGLGGGSGPEQRLEIMRDSRIGTYGTIAVILSLLVRVTALAGFSSLTDAAAALVTLNCLSRGAIVVLVATLEPARPEGMGAVVGYPGRRTVLAGILLAVAPIVFWPRLVGAAVLGAAAIATFTMWGLGRRQIRGYTGDLLGAGQQVCECAGWIVLAAMIS